MTTRCPRCAQPIVEPNALFCPACGKSLDAPTDGSPAPEPLVPRTELPPVDPSVAAAIAGARCGSHPDVPARDVCSRCGTFACASCVRATPEGQAVCADCATRMDLGRWNIPWERRAELGLFRGYWETAKTATFSPQRAFSGLAPSGSWWDATSYAIVSTALSSVVMVAIYGLIFGVAGIAAASSATSHVKGLEIAGIALGVLLTLAIALPLGAIMRVYLGAGIDHLGLRIVGGGGAGFDATVRAYCYSMSPAMFGLVPFCGIYVWEIWRIVLVIIAYRHVHKMDAGRAVAAVLVPFALCCGGYMALVMGAGFLGSRSK
jgi:hypothetical protein